MKKARRISRRAFFASVIGVLAGGMAATRAFSSEVDAGSREEPKVREANTR
jgi:hypothetical protein